MNLFTLLSKPHKDPAKAENYKLISVMDIDEYFLKNTWKLNARHTNKEKTVVIKREKSRIGKSFG